MHMSAAPPYPGGAAKGNSAADLICQCFFRELLKGASAGRAFIQARHDYVRREAPLDLVALKTLAQFVLLGDPSIHPVKPDPVSEDALLLTKAAQKDRQRRRRLLERHARNLDLTTAIVEEHRMTKLNQKELTKYMGDFNISSFDIESASKIPFQEPEAPLRAKGLKRAHSDGNVIVISGIKRAWKEGPNNPILKRRRKKSRMEFIRESRLLIAKKFDDKVELVKLQPR